MSNIEEAKRLSRLVRYETRFSANTAERVGSALLAIIASLEDEASNIEDLGEHLESIPDAMTFDLSGDSGIAWGETKTIRARIVNGYGNDVTELYNMWSITRNSGDAISDGIWNGSEKAVNFDGTIDITYSDECDDVGKGFTTTYTVSAWKDGASLNGIFEI